MARAVTLRRALRVVLAASCAAFAVQVYGCSLRSFSGFDDAFGRTDAAPDASGLTPDAAEPRDGASTARDPCAPTWDILKDLSVDQTDPDFQFYAMDDVEGTLWASARRPTDDRGLVLRVAPGAASADVVLRLPVPPAGVVRPLGYPELLVAAGRFLYRFDGGSGATGTAFDFGKAGVAVNDVTSRDDEVFAVAVDKRDEPPDLYRFRAGLQQSGVAPIGFTAKRVVALGGTAPTVAVGGALEGFATGRLDAGLALYDTAAFDGGAPRVLERTAGVTALAAFGDTLVYATEAQSSRPAEVYVTSSSGAPRLLASSPAGRVVGLAVDEDFVFIQTGRTARILGLDGVERCERFLASATTEAFRADRSGATVVMGRDAVAWVSNVRLYRMKLTR